MRAKKPLWIAAAVGIAAALALSAWASARARIAENDAARAIHPGGPSTRGRRP
jgi:hypothetical protein